MNERTFRAVELLKRLIRTPSLSREEQAAADIMEEYLRRDSTVVYRHANNVWAVAKHFDETKPTILLNSHVDTVKANKDWTKDPFGAEQEGDVLYGLGSNDAGGPLVTYATVFIHFAEQEPTSCNIIFAATAEEEISGSNGIVSILEKLPNVDLALVGEPTEMQMAVAEKGLMVVQCAARGKSGHAARNEGENAIDKALRDVQWFHEYRFPKESAQLGPIKMTTTIINAGTQHNVVPDVCTFTVDIRTTDAYTHDEVLEVITQNIESEIEKVSKRLHPSHIEMTHPIVRAAERCGMGLYGSPTLSDQSLMTMPRVKIGPGSSSRSHTANEYIRITEIDEGIDLMQRLIHEAVKEMSQHTRKEQ